MKNNKNIGGIFNEMMSDLKYIKLTTYFSYRKK